MTTPYEDLKYLQRTGCWKDGIVPKWAAERAEKLHCSQTVAAVLEWAYEHEIQRLANEIDRLNALVSVWHETYEECTHERMFQHVMKRSRAMSRKLRNMRKVFSQFAAHVGNQAWRELYNEKNKP